jgi:hypothetical protein
MDPILSHPWQHLLLLLPVIIAIPTLVRWNQSVVLICISFITREIEHFIYLLAICTSPLRIYCLIHMSISSFGVGSFIRSFLVPCRFWILVCYQMNSWQRFCPILGLSLESDDCFLLDAEPFEFCLGSLSLYLSIPVYFLLFLGVVSNF